MLTSRKEKPNGHLAILKVNTHEWHGLVPRLMLLWKLAIRGILRSNKGPKHRSRDSWALLRADLIFGTASGEKHRVIIKIASQVTRLIAYIDFRPGDRKIPIRWLTSVDVLENFAHALQPCHFVDLFRLHVVLAYQGETRASLDILFCDQIHIYVRLSICWKHP